jgi:hypothetical protein
VTSGVSSAEFYVRLKDLNLDDCGPPLTTAERIAYFAGFNDAPEYMHEVSTRLEINAYLQKLTEEGPII